MASRMIGRATCPECGFSSAHVKESEKCVYRYCPECSSQHHARTERQRADLMAKTRLIDAPEPTSTPSPTATARPEPASATPTPTPSGPNKAETPSPTPTSPTPKRRGLFS